jgi:hypothetical protein
MAVLTGKILMNEEEFHLPIVAQNACSLSDGNTCSDARSLRNADK